jgi:hypothetical protein
MPRKVEVIDDDGNIIAQPPPDHPVMAIIYLMEYGRRRGFQIGPQVQVADCIVQVRDIRTEKEGQKPYTDLEEGSDMDLVLRGNG